MNEKNPNIVILLEEKIDINKVIDILREDWGFECKYDISEQSQFMNYSFVYEDILFSLSEFCTKFPEDLSEDIENSCYVDENKIEEFYEKYNNFWIVTVMKNNEEDFNKIYSLFTRVVMSMLNVSKEALVYDVRSRLVIGSEIYLQMYQHMKAAYERKQYFFPTDWYVNIQVYQDKDGIGAVTQGFTVFNDYEIEIHNKQLEYEELYKIVKYIIVNVISRQDKISNMDTIPVPIGTSYEQAIVKQFYSEMLEEEALAIIF